MNSIASPKVFISHSSADAWVAEQIAAHIRNCGAETFLDCLDIKHGDDFEDRILEAAENSTELLVLLTPWSTNRHYIWLEIGAFWGYRKRMVGVLHGVTPNELSTDERIPVALKRLHMINLNDIASYFMQLTDRVNHCRASNAKT